MAFEPFVNVTTAVSAQTEAVQSVVVPSLASWPPQVFFALAILTGALLLLAGFALIRPINFCVGCYIGGSLAILALTLFAPPDTECGIIIGVPLVSALLAGALFAWKRGSMFAVMGLIAGELVGRVFFHVTLARLHAPEYIAFACVGFFAVVLSCFFFYVGDGIWICACSFTGAYIAVANFLQLLVVPFFPNLHLDHFIDLQWPEITKLSDAEYRGYMVRYFTSEPAIFVPLLVVCLLGAFGAYFQVKTFITKKPRKDPELAVETLH